MDSIKEGMNVTRIELIKSCLYCSHRHTELNGIINKKPEYVCLRSSTSYLWDLKGKPRKLENLDIIPDWCKLEEISPEIEGLHREDVKKEE